MSIQFNCEKCDRVLATPPETAGKTCRCPGCGHTMVVPQQSLFDQVEEAPQGTGNHDASPVMGSSVVGNGPSPFSQSLDESPSLGQAGSPYAPPSGHAGGNFHGHSGSQRTTTILTLGILSLTLGAFSCGCCILTVPVGLGLGITAVAMARTDMAGIRAGAMDPSLLENTRAGMICGIIGIVLSSLGIIGLGFGFAVELLGGNL